MAFDTLNIFHDGTAVTADLAPTSLTRTGGSAVLDLKQSPATGWAVVLIIPAEPTGTSPTLQVTIEDSNSVGTGYRERARFPALSGAAQRGTYIIRFDTDRRYVRANIDIGGTTPSYTPHILLCPPAFRIL